MEVTEQLDPRVAKVRRSKYVHAFRFRQDAYAYLPQSGDLLQLTEPLHAALTQRQDGKSMFAIRDAIERAWGRAQVRNAVADLKSLRTLGYLASINEDASAEADEFIMGLIRHSPRNLMLLVTEACNLRCKYCYETPNGVHDRARSLKTGMLERVIDTYISDSGIRSHIAITFFGGEPLLNFAAIQHAVAYANTQAKQHGKAIAYTITTNLTLLTPEITQFLCDNKFAVMVSMDGGREIQDAQRPTKSGQGTYATVSENLNSLLAAQRRCGVRPARIRATLLGDRSNPLAIEKQLLHFGAYDVSLGEATQSRPTEGVQKSQEAGDTRLDCRESGRPSAEHWRAHIDSYVEGLETGRHRELSPTVVKALRAIKEDVARTEVRDSALPKLCGVCRNMKAVTPAGDYYPCHRYVGMEAFRIGDVQAGVDEERVRSYYHSIMDAYRAKCQHCWNRSICGGECAWVLSSDEGQVRVPDEDDCQERRLGTERTLGLFGFLARNHPKLLGELVSGPRGAPRQENRQLDATERIDSRREVQSK